MCKIEQGEAWSVSVTLMGCHSHVHQTIRQCSSTSNWAVWWTSRCLGKLLSTLWTTFSLSLTADNVGCDLPVTEPVSFHGPITVSATDVSLLLDPEYGMLYLQNYDTTSALDFLRANWSRICLSRALNHSALRYISLMRLRNILTYFLLIITVWHWLAQMFIVLITFNIYELSIWLKHSPCR